MYEDYIGIQELKNTTQKAYKFHNKSNKIILSIPTKPRTSVTAPKDYTLTFLLNI